MTDPIVAVPDAAAKPAEGARTISKLKEKRRKFTTRSKRGGKKHRSKAEQSKVESEEAASEHARKIALFHSLEKRIARASGAELIALKAEQEKLGGLKEYQQASMHGARHGDSSKWLIATLEKRHGRRPTRLLDVGAIAGTSYKKYKSIDATYIDINPQADHVIKSDFLEFPEPEVPYDVVCLSLVLNFVGSIEDRVEMLVRAHLFTQPEGYLYVVLPLACVGK